MSVDCHPERRGIASKSLWSLGLQPLVIHDPPCGEKDPVNFYPKDLLLNRLVAGVFLYKKIPSTSLVRGKTLT